MEQQNSNIETNTNELSLIQKVTGIFLTPQDTFKAIDQKPDWFAPLMIILIITLAFTLITMPITMPEQMEKQREKMEEKGMSDEQIEQGIAVGEKIGKIMGPIGAVIGTVIMLLILTLVVWFVGNIVLGGQTSFKKMFSVYTYTSLIGMLGMILKTPLILSKKTADIHFSLASFMSEDQSKTYLYNFLKTLDIFAIWHYVVLAIGMAVIYKFTVKKTGVAVGIVVVLISLIAAFFMTKYA